VKEISINYTKIHTPAYNITEIPNRKVLDSAILNYSGKKDIIDYSLEIGFPHGKYSKQGANRRMRYAYY
jgi:small-conductance mechanosensitive channel